ncbi:hypothetical protein WSK_3135 [Novosphingobium sp. Rr 2-17]|nr:hypothetical protein WSK_3135 [Novosphingobium sp. Rr 2-17]
MWGYYADSHHGYCLEFATDRPPLINALEVTYDVERPVFRPFGSRDIDEIMISTLLQKAKGWEHESEYRLIRPGEVGVMKMAGDALNSIILGAAIKKEDEDALRRMAKERANPVKFKRTVLDRKAYCLSVIDA